MQPRSQQAISEAHAALSSKATLADVAQGTIAKTPRPETASLAPTGTKAGGAYVYPNSSLTPGATLTTDASTICALGYASSVRDVSTATKEQIYAEQGVSYPQPLGLYDVDRFIPLEIGGSNDIKNLWLESAAPHAGFPSKRPV